MAGHYPEGRSGNKGVEPEGMEVATFGGEDYVFLLSERGSVIGVYARHRAARRAAQLLPTALAPEGAVAVPARGLLAVSNEADLIEDGGVRSHVTIYAFSEERARRPIRMTARSRRGGPPDRLGRAVGLTVDPGCRAGSTP